MFNVIGNPVYIHHKVINLPKKKHTHKLIIKVQHIFIFQLFQKSLNHPKIELKTRSIKAYNICKNYS